jgi:hypothetical protein
MFLMLISRFLGNGTTSFPTPGTISGTITYYITDLPQYSGLAPCATDAVSGVIQQLTYTYCQSAPNALASCACFKNQNSAALSKELESSVDYECSSTASADVTSALAVFDFYCSAAGGKAVASGVTASGMRFSFSPHCHLALSGFTGSVNFVS